MALTYTDLHVHSEFSLQEIPGFDGRYLASYDGKIFNKFGEEKTSFVSKTGYLRVKLYVGNNKYRNYSVHRLIAETFIQNPDNKPQVNHKDTNKLNPHVSNLEWSDQPENIRHAIDNGLYGQQLANQSLAAKASSDRHSIAVEQLNDNGDVINTFRNKHDAARALDIMPNNIKRAILTGNKCGGYRWRKAGGCNE